MSQPLRSLIVRLPNWVGDVIMALPALHALQNNEIELELLGKPWIMDLLSGITTPLHALEKTFWKTKNKIATIATDKALVLTNSFSSAAMTRFAGKNTIGYKTDGRQLFLKAGLRKIPNQHEVEYFWNIAHLACQTWFPETSWPQKIPPKITLPLKNSVLINAKNALINANINELYWVLCPFAHGTGNNNQSKIWPHWRKLSKNLKHKKLIVCPAVNEEQLCSELVPEAQMLTGLNLAEYAAVLAGAERVIANDSGPMHLAAAVGANTLGIFGVSDPKRTRPWGAAYIGNQDCWPTVQEVLIQLESMSSV